MNEKDLLEQMSEANETKITPKQAKIIQAAIETFSEKGYAATSTKEIAEKAGVAEGTIFRHYKTKKDLLLSIVSPIIINFALPFFLEKFVKDVFSNENSHDRFDEMLQKLIYNRFEFIKDNVPLIKIFLQEIAFHKEIENKIKQIYTKKIYPRFKEVVIQYKDEGEIGNYPVDTVIRLVMTTIIGFLITRFLVLPNHDWDDEKEIHYTIQFIRHGLKNI